MKILELRFKNLNSLYGEWVIDFTDPEYEANGIFALIGPTGAGKSTILDAICLALYGATPRLGKITKSSNEIMSGQTGECYAEVLFQSQAGIYRSHWEQRRARKSPNGKLQDQEHQIANGLTGKLIETKKSRVVSIVEQKTGMDFDRFTRSILLAQGSFDSFLRADIEEKSKILEQITGTEIYTKISQKVHERHRDERNKLDLLASELTGIELLDHSQIDQLNTLLNDYKLQIEQLINQIVSTNDSINWLKNITELKAEIQSLEQQKQALVIQNESSNSIRSTLRLAQKASSLDAIYSKIQTIREHLNTHSKNFEKQNQDLPTIQLKISELEKAFDSSALHLATVKTSLESHRPIFKKVRQLDQELKNTADHIANLQTKLHANQDKLKSTQQDQDTYQGQLNQVHDQQKHTTEYLTQNAADEWLVSGFTGVKTQFDTLAIMDSNISKFKEELIATENALLDLANKSQGCKDLQQELELKAKLAYKDMKQAKQSLDKLLDGKLTREYHSRKEALLRELALVQRIQELDEHRKSLQDGNPCPLCGSAEHPFAMGNVPETNPIEQEIEELSRLLDSIEQQERHNRELEKREQSIQADFVRNQYDQTNLQQATESIKTTLSKTKDDIEESEFERGKTVKQILDQLTPLGIIELPQAETSEIASSLHNRLTKWLSKKEEHNKFEVLITKAKFDISKLDSLMSEQRRIIDENESELNNSNKKLLREQAERIELYEDKDPDHEEQALEHQLKVAQQTQKTNNDQLISTKEQCLTITTTLENLKKSICEFELKLKDLETDFRAMLTTEGFDNEAAYLQAKLTSSQRQQIDEQIRQLDERITQNDIKLEDRINKLNSIQSKQLTENTLETLEGNLQQFNMQQHEISDQMAIIKNRLIENSKAQDQLKDKQLQIESLKEECSRWEKLHGLIGSADGKKFRNFAQGLTFEVMVGHANLQLSKMSDRYLLVRDLEEPLELNVIDAYQAGEMRSTRNLSGGESFIVSLTLALGLSKMSSEKVRVDSLFLDEGFGTLDEDALESALDTLSSLHEDGKLIGVISHVSALKERVRTQISVEKQVGGSSKISGPGCTSLI